jgi:hypothetical protein
MTTKPEAFSCATSLSATTLDMVSADWRPRQRFAAGQGNRQRRFNVTRVGGRELLIVQIA